MGKVLKILGAAPGYRPVKRLASLGLRVFPARGWRDVSWLSREKGSLLVEALVAIAIVGTGFVALLQGLSTGSIANRTVDQSVTAQNIASNQLESVRNEPYSSPPYSYPTIADVPAGYSVTVEAEPIVGRDSNTEKIVVTVFREGEVVLVVEDYKTNR